MRKVHGIKVDTITHKEPGNGLPKWVKEKAATRGYADSLEPLSLFVTEKDIDAAFDCVGHGDGAKCVMAQAGQRLGAEQIYFYRTTAWIDFGTGPILRFLTSKSIYKNIIEPFDKGSRRAIIGGVYPLSPPTRSRSLRRRREYEKSHRNVETKRKTRRSIVSHTERVVIAAHV